MSKSKIEIAKKQRQVFADNFNRILRLRGKTQADVVVALGITASTVSDWATGKKYPRVDSMQLIADFLGVLLSDLREEKPADTKDDGQTILENRVLTLFRRIPEESQPLVLGMIEAALRSQGLL